MKINEYNSMMSYLTRPAKVLGNNINDKKINDSGARTALKKGSSDTKPTAKNNKMLKYIDDHQIVYDGKEATKADAEAAAKRIDSYKNQMSKQDEYNTYFNKKSPKYYNKIVVERPKPLQQHGPDKPNGHSNWTTEDWLHTIDPTLWIDDDDKKAELNESLFEEYLRLLKAGELQPGTSFERFEKLYYDFDTDVISKINKKVLEKKKKEGLAAILGVKV